MSNDLFSIQANTLLAQWIKCRATPSAAIKARACCREVSYASVEKGAKIGREWRKLLYDGTEYCKDRQMCLSTSEFEIFLSWKAPYDSRYQLYLRWPVRAAVSNSDTELTVGEDCVVEKQIEFVLDQEFEMVRTHIHLTHIEITLEDLIRSSSDHGYRGLSCIYQRQRRSAVCQIHTNVPSSFSPGLISATPSTRIVRTHHNHLLLLD